MTDHPELVRALGEGLEPGEHRASVALVPRTLSDVENRLPMGTPVVWRPPVFGVQREQGKIRARPDLQAHPGRSLAHWIAAAFESVGEATEAAAKVAAVIAAPFGDVVTAITAWNHKKHPAGFPLGRTSCGYCGASMGEVRVPLQTLEVGFAPRGSEPTAEVRLVDPLPVAGVEVNALRLRPPLFSSVVGLGPDGWRNPDEVRSRLLVDAIVETDADVEIGIDDLDWLTAANLRALERALEAITPTADLEVEVACPECGATNASIVDWRDPAFSSR